jgi:hypothetical protein
MNKFKYIIIVLVLFSTFPLFAFAEGKGSVCLGPFLSVVFYEPLKRPFLTIGDYGPFHFDQKSQPTRLVAEGLDLNKPYIVKVHFGGKVVTSWKLNFEKLNADMVYIWRSKGAWRMEPITNGKCECPKKRTR